MDIVIIAALAAALIGIYIRRYYMLQKVSEHNKASSYSSFTPKKKEEKTEEKSQKHERKYSTGLIPKSREAKVLYSQALAFIDRSELDEAAKKLIQVTSIEVDFHEAEHRLGLIYLRQNQFGKAEAIYKHLIVKSPEKSVYYSNLGRALYEQKKFQESLAAYLKSLQLDNSRPGRFVSVAEVYRQLDDKEKAMEMYQKALDLDPANIDYLLTFAHFLLEDKRFEQARFYLEKVLKLQPDNSIALDMMKEVEG